MACVPREDSAEPGYPPSLIRVFAVRMKEAWVLNYPLSAQRRLIRLSGCPGWSWVFCWVHSHFVGFVMRQLKFSFVCSPNFSEPKELKKFIAPYGTSFGTQQWCKQDRSPLHRCDFFFLRRSNALNEPRHQKTCLCHMRTTNVQISLHICAVSPAPLLFTAYIV